MEKGVCPNCHNLVSLELGRDVETCSHCQKDYVPQQAKRLFGLLYSQYASNGNVALNLSSNYPKALENFTKLLALDSDSIDGIFGVAHSRIANATIDGEELEHIVAFLHINEDKILANTTLYDDIARNFLALGQRIDSYVRACDTRLITETKFIDHAAMERHKVIWTSAIEYWEYLEHFFAEHFAQLPNENAIIKDRLIELRKEQKSYGKSVVLNNNENRYEVIKNKAVFASKMSLYRARLTMVIVQVIAVIGSIIGFSIMMADYASNPFPGLIVFGVFALFFIIGNIIGRIVKKKLAK